MFFAPVRRRTLSLLALALVAATAGCSHPTISAVAAPVYPGAKIEKSGKTFSTGDSFDTVYAWYKKNLPTGAEESRITAPAQAVVFFVGTGNDRLSITVTQSPLCCKTLILFAAPNAA